MSILLLPNIRYVDGKFKRFLIAVLVLETFVSHRPKGMFACHGIRGNQIDSLDNIYWGTPSRNAQDRLRDGTMQNGEKHYAHKITEEDVLFIRGHYSPHGKNGISQLELANMFHLHRNTVLKIIHRIKWKHI